MLATGKLPITRCCMIAELVSDLYEIDHELNATSQGICWSYNLLTKIAIEDVESVIVTYLKYISIASCG